MFHLSGSGGLSLDEIDVLLNQRSGLLGLCGDNDMRAVLARRADGDAAATLAFDVYCERIKAYVGAYAACSAGSTRSPSPRASARTQPPVRAAALSNLEASASWWIRTATPRRAVASGSSRPTARPVAVCVVPTDEELEIATQTRAVIGVGAHGAAPPAAST